MADVFSLPHFSYETLQDDQIRVLTLLPGPESSPICCEIQTVSRASAASSFSALSYCWGPQPQALEAIAIKNVVNDAGKGKKVVNGDSRLSVWPNLYNVLVTLRRLSEEPQRLWIDAICIDQSCLLEKENQIRLMSRIYISALNVIIWLGEAGEDSDYVMESISNDYIKDFATERFMLGMIAILARPWFQRTWIVQEFVLNPAAPLIACGCQRMVTWESFKMAYIAAFPLAVNSSPLSSSSSVSMTSSMDRWVHDHGAYIFLNSFRNSIQSRHPGSSHFHLRDTLYATRSLHVTDPRDKIYGILALTSERTQKELEADYNKSVDEVFRDAMVYILQKEKSAAIYGYFPLTRNSISTLPSWVPNFAAAQDSQPIPDSPILGEAIPQHNSEAVKLSSCKNKLIVKGRLLDIVETVITTPTKVRNSSFWAYPQILISTLAIFTSVKMLEFAKWSGFKVFEDNSEEFSSLSFWNYVVLMDQSSRWRIDGIRLGQVLTEIQRLVMKCNRRLGNTIEIEPLWKLLLVPSPAPRRLESDEESQADFDNMVAAFRKVGAGGRLYKWWILNDLVALNSQMKETAPLSTHLVDRIGEGTNFFACDKGWYGMCEGEVQVRDQLVLLFPDANVPFILRKRGDCFEMVGPARVPDGMQDIIVTPGASHLQEFVIE